MRAVLAFALATSTGVSLATPASAIAQGGDMPLPPRPAALEGIQIDDKSGQKVPLDVELTDESGAAVTLARYFSGERSGKPVLLTLGYYQCPMLCSLVLNATLDALKQLSLEMGEDFTVVTVSIDPKETAALAREKRGNYLESYGRQGAAAGWHFHVGDEREVRRLAAAVGFNYRYDEATQQYAHAAGIFFLAPDGTLARTLWGMSYDSTDVKLALMEASRGEVGSVGDQILMSCFQYTPDKQRYGVYVWGVMRLGGILTILGLGTFLLVLWRRERRRHDAET